MASKKERIYSDLQLYKLIISLSKPLWLLLSIVFLLDFLLIPLTLLNPVPIKLLIDNVVGSQNLPGILDTFIPTFAIDSKYNLLIFTIILLVFISLLNSIITQANSIVKKYTGEKLVISLQSKLFSHAQSLSLAYHDHKGTSDTTYRIQYDASSIEWILLGLSPVITGVFQILSMIYVIAIIDISLAVTAAMIVPILFLISRSKLPKLRAKWANWSELKSSSMSILQETLNSLRIVKSFGQEKIHKKEFVSKSHEAFKEKIRIAFDEGKYGVILGLLITAATAVIIYSGTLQVLNGTLTIGVLLIVITYISQFYGPVEGITWSLINLQPNLASFERAVSILKQLPEVEEKKNPLSITKAEGNISFENVYFSYDKKRDVLTNISFSIKKGTRVGLIGKTGAGKSTLLSLLFRFYDPIKGLITLDGTDIRDFRLQDLRKQFSIVLGNVQGLMAVFP